MVLKCVYKVFNFCFYEKKNHPKVYNSESIFDMGGCRCTYRNCTVKSDGKTHMFHYPVFEKIRCHQWLINAHRLDFLELKVSQLKNRVVCQHHFKDEVFMNYKKDKLIFDAIPTENGPFCDTSKFVDHSQENIKSFPTLILFEDIEKEVMFDDKKENLSLKYGDFLTNGELSDSSTRYNSNIINLTKEKSKTNLKSNLVLKGKVGYVKPAKFIPNVTRLSLPSKLVKRNPKPQPTQILSPKPQATLIVPPYTDFSHEIAAGNEINPQLRTTNKLQSESIVQPTNSRSLIIPQNHVPQNAGKTEVKQEPKIKILSEEKLDRLIPVIGKLEKVSPSTTIIIPDKNKDKSINVQLKNLKKEKPSDKVTVLEVLDVEYEPLNQAKTSIVPDQIQPNLETKANNTTPQQQLKTAKIKNKLTPERTAAIEKKREFNMKMKDILETCLDKIDEPRIRREENPTKTSSRSLIKQPASQVSAQPIGEEVVPNVQQYTIAYLDERMKSMEKLLLNKIEQNSQKITELTESFTSTKNGKESVQMKHVNAQTKNGDNYKRFLYEEISKYISPNSKSLIYEELFINQFSVDISGPQKKRRKKFI